MDTEEHIKIQKATARGLPPTDEGPYYHDSWWEAYKGGNRGYLGGAVAYTGVGVAVGVICAAALILTGIAAASAALPIITGITAASMMYGLHEFHDIGKIVGSGAAIAEKQEERSNKKFTALERKLDEIKAMISGKKLPPAPEFPAAGASDDSGHRTTHLGEHSIGSKWVFWKVAAIGLAVGLAAGALLAGGGLAGIVLEQLGKAGVTMGSTLTGGQLFAATMIPLGLFGASFGINRDIFRHVFDKTDLLFKGLSSSEVGHSRQQELPEKPPSSPVFTVVYPPDMINYPASDTYHRDKYKLDSAKLALHSLDPSKTIRQ